MGFQSLDAEPVGEFQVIYSFIYRASASRRILSLVFCCLFFWDTAEHVPCICMGSKSLDAEPVGESCHAAMLQILMLPRSILPANTPSKVLIQ